MRKIIVKKKYKDVRFPREAYDDAIKSKKVMELTLKKLLGRPARIPLTRVIKIKMASPTTLTDRDLIKLVRNKRK